MASHHVSNQASLPRRSILPACTVLSLSFAILAYKRALDPLYASVPTQLYLSQAVIVGSALGSLFSLSIANAAAIYAALLAVAPQTIYWTAVYSARFGDPVLGPVFMHAITLVPIIGVGVALIHSSQGCTTNISRFTHLPLYCFVFPTLDPLWNIIPPLLSLPSTEIFFALAVSVFGVLFTVEILSLVQSAPPPIKENASLPKSRSIVRLSSYVVIIALSCISVQHAPTLHSRFRKVGPGSYVDPTSTVKILSSVQSTTGVIVVGEALPLPPNSQNSRLTSFRYLRASHSLLGGSWIGSEATIKDDMFASFDSYGQRLGDSIYSTFALQEAVRLVNSTSRGSDWTNSDALIIGVGAGFAPSSLQKHGISTTIVEIDPAVYTAARTYFGLPDPGEGKVFLEDARSWVVKKREAIKSGQKELFDIVIHDCFSGGGVPSHIFTVEFWQELKDIIKPDSIVAVNFAGKPGSKSSRAVVSTLLAVFGQCRAFYDSHQVLSEEDLKKEFLNLVFFCTPIPSSKKRLTFRPAQEIDFLGSHLREFILKSLERREIDVHLILDSGSEDFGFAPTILTDNANPLDKLQKEETLHHWKVMREVLPDVFWETY